MAADIYYLTANLRLFYRDAGYVESYDFTPLPLEGIDTHAPLWLAAMAELIGDDYTTLESLEYSYPPIGVDNTKLLYTSQRLMLRINDDHAFEVVGTYLLHLDNIIQGMGGIEEFLHRLLTEGLSPTDLPLINLDYLNRYTDFEPHRDRVLKDINPELIRVDYYVRSARDAILTGMGVEPENIPTSAVLLSLVNRLDHQLLDNLSILTHLRYGIKAANNPDAYIHQWGGTMVDLWNQIHTALSTLETHTDMAHGRTSYLTRRP